MQQQDEVPVVGGVSLITITRRFSLIEGGGRVEEVAAANPFR